ncbi:hypothetical protein M8818_003558 [Zalaria obscura]|uniref:Uncharacterized protein n=1 Tax=Zalaria obscura TaxID=2024903 RepID=A0ACC3SFJ6_9PEZI
MGFSERQDAFVGGKNRRQIPRNSSSCNGPSLAGNSAETRQDMCLPCDLQGHFKQCPDTLPKHLIPRSVGDTASPKRFYNATVTARGFLRLSHSTLPEAWRPKHADPLSRNRRHYQDGTMTSNNGSNGYSDEQSSGKGKRMSAEDVARLVWNHTKVTADMTRELNGTQEDELKLMRVRTKRNELVIVPDAKFIAVVIHDTPPA